MEAFCVSIDSKPSLGGLDKEFQDVVNLNKYAPATRQLIDRILKALQVFDCYDTMVRNKRPLWTLGSELSSAAFDALRGLKKTQQQFTNTISVSLVELKNLQTTLQKKPDIVGQIDNKNSPCFMGGVMYHKDDCEKCRISIPGFKSKSKSMSELRGIILNLQATIPKQFMYYGNDLFVVVAESIRIIDKMYDCLEFQNDTAKCESRDKSFILFTRRMNLVTTNENDHAKMILYEGIKLKTIVSQLVQEVTGTMEMMAECLNFKSGLSLFDLWKKGVLPSVEPAAKNVGVDMDKAKATDTKRVVSTLLHGDGISVGTKLSKALRY